MLYYLSKTKHNIRQFHFKTHKNIRLNKTKLTFNFSSFQIIDPSVRGLLVTEYLHLDGTNYLKLCY